MTSRAPRLPVPLVLGLLLGFLFSFVQPGVETGSGGSTLVVPPYLDTVVFDVVGERRGSDVEIFPPGLAGRKSTAGPEGMEEIWLGESLLAIGLHRPVPGRWTFRTKRPAAIRILAQRFFPRGTLLAPAAETAIRPNDRIFIAYRLLDGDGFPLQELPGYPLEPNITLIGPDGRRSRLSMERRPDLGVGVFRARELARCNLPGRYWTEVMVATRSLDGRTVTVFQDRWSGFSVGSLPPRHKHP